MDRQAMSSCDDCSQSEKTMRTISFHACENSQCNLESVRDQPDFDPLEWARLSFCSRCLVNNYKSPPPCEYTLGGRNAVIENEGSTEKFICPRCCGLPHPEGRNPKKPVKIARMPIEAQLVLVDGQGNIQVPAMQLDAAGLVKWAQSLANSRRSELCQRVKGLSKLVKQFEKAQVRERGGAGKSSSGEEAQTPFLFTVEEDGIAATVSCKTPVVAFEWTKPRVDAFIEASKPNSNLQVFSSKSEHHSWRFFGSALYGESWPKPGRKHVRNAKCPLQDADNCLLRVSFTIPGYPSELSEYIEQRKASMQAAGRKRSTGGGRGGLTSSNKRDQAPAEGRQVKTERPLSTKDAPNISYCKLPAPTPPARPPKDSAITVKFEAENVVRLDISAAVTDNRLSVQDEKYVMELCDDPDATVVIKGLTDSLNPVLWTWEYILARCGHVVWKKVRVFEKKHPESEQWYERGWKTMSLQDYHEYLLRRQAGDPDALSSVWYWIDFPMKEYLPELYQDYQRATPLDLLPGGKYCAQQWVASSARPDMGPNLYITPPGGRTWFHEDGNGTVDSGHQCMTGRNEVIMLRRITDEPTRLKVLNKLNGGEALDMALPHDDAVTSTARKQWPTKNTLQYLRDELHASPSSIVLGPGEYLHIGKGRLHAFRKKEPPRDRPEAAQDVCISVAWDWMYEGCSSRGIAGEAATVAFNASLNERWRRQSLSIHDSALLHGAFSRLGHLRSAQAVHNLDVHSLVDETCSAYLDNKIACSGLHEYEEAEREQQKTAEDHSELLDKLMDECSAVQPYLNKVTESKLENDDVTRMSRLVRENGRAGDLQRAELDVSRVDAHTDAGMGDLYSPNAFALAGYSCEVCQGELSNEYLHCMGCSYREYDYNVCAKCFEAKHHTYNDKEHVPRSARTLPGAECFCGAQPCMQCTAGSHGGVGCRCCMCYQVRWRYAQHTDLKALNDNFRAVSIDSNCQCRKKTDEKASDQMSKACAPVKPDQTTRRTRKRVRSVEETESDETAESQVAAVVGKEVRQSQTGRQECFYRVRWKGLSTDDDTWEPLSSLNHAKDLLVQYERQMNQSPARGHNGKSRKHDGVVDGRQGDGRKARQDNKHKAVEAEEIFAVQAILQKRGPKTQREYKIRWRGYGPDDDTWEPVRNLGDYGTQLAAEFEDQTREASSSRKDTGKRGKPEDASEATPSVAAKRSTQSQNAEPAWMKAMQGWGLKLPGSIWGLYGHDEATQVWAQQHKEEKFEVIIKSVSTTGVTIQYGEESPFVVAIETIWPHLTACQKRLATQKGAKPPSGLEASASSDTADMILRRKLRALVRGMKTAAANGDLEAGQVRVVVTEGSINKIGAYQVEDYDNDDTDEKHVLHGRWVAPGDSDDGVRQRLFAALGVPSPFLETEQPNADGFDDAGQGLCAGGWTIACVSKQMHAKLVSIRRWYTLQANKTPPP